MAMDIIELLCKVKGADKDIAEAAQKRQESLIKPSGSLGALEDISIKIAGITGKVRNKIDKKVLFLFGADNGVYDEGIAASPQHFTKTLMTNYAYNRKCAINVICKDCAVDLKLIDMGIKDGLNHPNVENRNLMPQGTNNFAIEPAMSRQVALAAMSIGAYYAGYALDNGYGLIGNGEVGMGNTTTAAACIMAASKTFDPEIAVGRGAGLDDAAFAKKKHIIKTALERYDLFGKDPIDILSAVGGLDIAAMTGLYLGAAYCRLPIVIDGLISASAALIAYKLQPLVKDFMIASHISEEPAYSIAIKTIGLEPILALRMRLGEGSGCPIAMKVIDTALAVMDDMSTFDELNVETDYRSGIKLA